jgi:hypothetical protein
MNNLKNDKIHCILNLRLQKINFNLYFYCFSSYFGKSQPYFVGKVFGKIKIQSIYQNIII